MAATARSGWLVALLVLLRVPFFWTGHLQEDAFIAFRAAFNLADHGELSFNLGEHYAASTSLVYAYFCAVTRSLTGASAVAVILAVNAALAALAVVHLCRVFELRGPRALLFVLLLGCAPGALLPAFNGMETAWCLLYLALLAEHAGDTAIRPWSFGALLGLGPLLRPDAVVFSGFALLARARGKADRQRRAWGIGGIALGIAVLAVHSRLHSNSWLPPSVIAKQAAYHPDLSPRALLERAWEIYMGGPFSLLPSTKYLPAALMAVASLCCWLLLAVAARHAHARWPAPRARSLLFLAASAACFPIVLAAPGALFPWYYYPSSFALAACLTLGLLTGSFRGAAPRVSALALALGFVSLAAEFSISLNVGRQESGYRASIGTFLAQIAPPGATLVLEPAGIIPYRSGLITYDEVGLTSPRVLPFLASRRSTWLAEFLHAMCPTFTLQREAFPPLSGDREPSADERWFQRSYGVRQRFVYEPDAWARNALERWLLGRGSHSGYLLYERRAGVDCTLGGSQRSRDP